MFVLFDKTKILLDKLEILLSKFFVFVICWANHLFDFYFVGQKQIFCWAEFVFVGPFVGQKEKGCWANYLLGKLCYFVGQINKCYLLVK